MSDKSELSYDEEPKTICMGESRDADEIVAKASVPEPPPKGGEIEVTPKIIEWIQCMDILDEHIKRDLITLIKERSKYGFDKYNTKLRTNNGRNQYEDARQEFGDFIHYVFACILEERDDSKIGELLLSAMITSGLLYTQWGIMKRIKESS